MDKIKEILDRVLVGIDKTESQTIDGWWETSGGAEFGKKKKEELLKELFSYYVQIKGDNMDQNTQSLVEARKKAEQNHTQAWADLKAHPTKENVARVDSATKELYNAQDSYREHLKSKIKMVAKRLGLI